MGRSMQVATVNDTILAIMQNFPRSLGRTELMKLVYLVDCEHYRLYGKTVTGLDYWRDHQGPVNYAIVDGANALAEADLISYGSYVTVNNRRRFLHAIKPAGRTAKIDCSPTELSVIRGTTLLAGTWSSQKIVEFAYATPPMQKILESEKLTGPCALRGEAVSMEELRATKPRFNLEELREVLHRKDLSVSPMTEEALTEARTLSQEFRPYRERACLVTGNASTSTGR